MEGIKSQTVGTVVGVRGEIAIIECDGDYRPHLREILTSRDNPSIILEAHAYHDTHELYCLLLSPRGDLSKHMSIIATGKTLTIPAGKAILGRAIDLHGAPQDGKGPLENPDVIPIYRSDKQHVYNDIAPDDATSGLIETGIKAIDIFTPVPRGGKIGLIGGAGVGKTMIMTEIMHNINSQGRSVSVFAGIGERIREGHELLKSLEKTQVLSRTALIVGSMNENASVRFKVAAAAAAIAEHFRDIEKQDVLFFVDNIFRFVQAGGELSSLLSEIPSEFGYQPTLDTEIAQFQSRLMSTKDAALTSIQTVYVPADLMTDPSVSATLPHLAATVFLSREIVHQGRQPAVDFVRSKSAIIDRELLGDDHYEVVVQSIELLNHYERLSRITAIIGEEELSIHDRKIFDRAKKILYYSTQPFFLLHLIRQVREVLLLREKMPYAI